MLEIQLVMPELILEMRRLGIILIMLVQLVKMIEMLLEMILGIKLLQLLALGDNAARNY